MLKYQELIKVKGITEAKVQAYFKEEIADQKEEEASLTLQQVSNEPVTLEAESSPLMSDINEDESMYENENYEDIDVIEDSKENNENTAKATKATKMEHCVECKKDFANLRSHIRNVHKVGSEKLDCPTCHKQFWGAHSLKNHMLCHDENRLECPKCPGKTFAKSTFVNHIREVHRVGKHIPCTVAECKVKFRKKGDMLRHIAIVHENKKELCTECGESFKNLKYHQASVHQGLRYKCQDCDKEYKTEKMLKQHRENIHEMKRSICDICAVEVIDLKNHMKLNHEGPIERTECCPDKTCDRKFRTGQEARKHYKSYHLEIKEMCQLCGGWFKALYQHMLAVHKNVKKHVCTDCNKGFGKKHDLLMHRNRVHLGIKYVCPHCGKQVSKLRDHIKLVHSLEKEIKTANTPVLTVSSKHTELPEKDLSHLPYTPSPTSCQVSEGLIPNQHHIPLHTTDTPVHLPIQPQSSSSQINDIIKRCVTNIDQKMSSCRINSLGEGAALNSLIDSVEPVHNHPNTNVITDFSVFSQLPSMHTVLDSDTMGLLGSTRNKMDKNMFPNQMNQMESLGRGPGEMMEGGESGVETTESNHNLGEADPNNLQVYQWLSPPM